MKHTPKTHLITKHITYVAVFAVITQLVRAGQNLSRSIECILSIVSIKDIYQINEFILFTFLFLISKGLWKYRGWTERVSSYNINPKKDITLAEENFTTPHNLAALVVTSLQLSQCSVRETWKPRNRSYQVLSLCTTEIEGDWFFSLEMRNAPKYSKINIEWVFVYIER